jgi:hemerythrin-like domain-containing protein
MSTPTASITDAPLDEFSNCHGGILQQLDALERLPALLAPAAEARRIAAEALDFFPTVVVEHHAEEERELFPAVLASATRGEERDQVQALIEQLVQEHRAVEAAWEALKPQMKAVAQGHDTTLDTAALAALVSRYKGHARFEETQFLPLSKAILGRNDNHMAALGVSLHMRRALPGVMERFGHRI